MATEVELQERIDLVDSEDEVGDEEGPEEVLEDEGSEDEEIVVGEVQQKRKKSNREPAPVWVHGGQKLPGGGAKCLLCDYTAPANKCNTSNLERHILNKHKTTKEGKALKVLVGDKKKRESAKKKKKEEKRRKVGTMLKFVSVQGVLSKSSKDAIEASIVKHFVCSNSPFSEAEETSFRNMVFQLNPNYIVPSEKTISRRVDEMFLVVKEDLKKEMVMEMNKTYHKTAHLAWDHGTSKDRFRTKKLGVSLCFVNSMGALINETLGAIRVTGSQTGITIRGLVKTTLEMIGLQEDWRFTATTDGASNVVSSRAPGRHQVNLVYICYHDL
jgi:hypothetical protein